MRRSVVAGGLVSGVDVEVVEVDVDGLDVEVDDVDGDGVDVDDEEPEVDGMDDVEDMELDDEDDVPELPLGAASVAPAWRGRLVESLVVVVRCGRSVEVPDTDVEAPATASTGNTGCSETSLSAASTARHATKVAAAVTTNHSRARPKRRMAPVSQLAVLYTSTNCQGLVNRASQTEPRL